MPYKSLILLLASLLLLPPGVCVCHVGDADCAAASEEASQGESTDGRHGAPLPPCPDRHAPGCPALAPVDGPAPPKPVQQDTPTTAAVAGLISAPAPAITPVVTGIPTPAPVSCSRPLYLSLRTLRI